MLFVYRSNNTVVRIHDIIYNEVRDEDQIKFNDLSLTCSILLYQLIVNYIYVSIKNLKILKIINKLILFWNLKINSLGCTSLEDFATFCKESLVLEYKIIFLRL